MSKIIIKNRYATTPNELLNNKEISLKAKGLFAFLQGKPDNWSFSTERIASQLKEGVRTVRSTLQELEKFGLLQRKLKPKDEQGKWTGYLYVLSDIPLQTNDSNVLKPSLPKPIGRVSDRTVLGEDISKKDFSKKDIVKKKDINWKAKPQANDAVGNKRHSPQANDDTHRRQQVPNKETHIKENKENFIKNLPLCDSDELVYEPLKGNKTKSTFLDRARAKKGKPPMLKKDPSTWSIINLYRRQYRYVTGKEAILSDADYFHVLKITKKMSPQDMEGMVVWYVKMDNKKFLAHPSLKSIFTVENVNKYNLQK